MLLEAAAGQGSMLSMLAPMALVFAVFYFLLIRPQQKQQKKHAGMVAALRAGDDVVTRSGIHGKVSAINEDGTLKIEIAKNVCVTMNRDFVAQVKTAENQKQDSKKKNAA